MLWHAMPPELNTARLMGGAGPAPMLQAATGWQVLAAALSSQAEHLATILARMGGTWTGASGEAAVAAAAPMVPWLHAVAAQAHKRGAQAAAQAAAYSTALAVTPSLPEIAANHITRAVLVATNFLGINMVPIGLKETDYFVRMWNQAAGAMDVYAAETMTNTTFDPPPPREPILLPGMGEIAEAGAISTLAELATNVADPHAFARMAAGLATEVPSDTLPTGERLMPFLTSIGQLAGPMQQLASTLQQTTSMTSGLGNADKLDEDLDDDPQMGLLGASPLSTHPLAGGTGPASGSGLLRAESLPGAGGVASRTPLLAGMLDTSAAAGPAMAATAAGAGAGTSAVGGAAPMAPLGAHGAAAGAARPAMAAPAVLARSPDDHDDVDEDDW